MDPLENLCPFAGGRKSPSSFLLLSRAPGCSYFSFPPSVLSPLAPTFPFTLHNFHFSPKLLVCLGSFAWLRQRSPVWEHLFREKNHVLLYFSFLHDRMVSSVLLSVQPSFASSPTSVFDSAGSRLPFAFQRETLSTLLRRRLTKLLLPPYGLYFLIVSPLVRHLVAQEGLSTRVVLPLWLLAEAFSTAGDFSCGQHSCSLSLVFDVLHSFLYFLLFCTLLFLLFILCSLVLTLYPKICTLYFCNSWLSTLDSLLRLL